MAVGSLALASTTCTPTVLYSITRKNISILQKHRTYVVTSPVSFSRVHNTPLQQLHWLSTEYRISFNMADITLRTVHSSQPAYRRSALRADYSTHSLGLTNANLLSASFVRTSLGGHISCSVAAPKIWKSFPPAGHPTHFIRAFLLASPQIRLPLTMLFVYK